MYVLPYGQMSLWGSLKCLKCLYNLLTLSFYPSICDSFLALLQSKSKEAILFYMIMPLLSTSKNKIKGLKRIGPHNKDIYSIIFGSLLGDSHAEKRNGGLGTRISFYQESTHLTYLLWLHSLLASKGYCNEKLPKIQSRLGKKGVVRKVLRFHTWTYTSFNTIHELWYAEKIKRVPSSIAEFLTPLALAIWIMDDGAKISKGLKFCSNSFSYFDCLLLVKVLHLNFNLKASVQSAGAPNQYVIYIWKESMNELRAIVSPYVINEMKYKIIE